MHDDYGTPNVLERWGDNSTARSMPQKSGVELVYSSLKMHNSCTSSPYLITRQGGLAEN